MMALWKNDGIKWSQIRSHLSQPWKQSQPCDASICHPRLYLSRSMQGLISVLFFHWHRTTKLCIEYNFRFRQFFRMLCIETFFVRCCSDVEMCQYITAIVVKNFILCYSLQIYNLFRFSIVAPFLHYLTDLFGNFERLRTNSYIWKLWKIEVDNEWYF